MGWQQLFFSGFWREIDRKITIKDFLIDLLRVQYSVQYTKSGTAQREGLGGL